VHDVDRAHARTQREKRARVATPPPCDAAHGQTLRTQTSFEWAARRTDARLLDPFLRQPVHQEADLVLATAPATTPIHVQNTHPYRLHET
jgi:hypothetical protein